ncbi:MAG TPA: hypothetical protein VGW39_05905 [Chthoniobacterales bacterium]|nr:hypothetical protein [Chthoniobacterales bacterium]
MSKTKSKSVKKGSKGGKDGKGKKGGYRPGGGSPIAVVLDEKTAKDLFLALALALGYPIDKKGGKKGKKGKKAKGKKGKGKKGSKGGKTPKKGSKGRR